MKIPSDLNAEEGVIGSLVLSAAAVWAVGDLNPDDFRDRCLARVFEAMVAYVEPDPGPVPADPGEWMRWVFPRRAYAAEVAGEGCDVERWVEQASFDPTAIAGMAARVADAAKRRRAMACLADAYNALGRGAALGEVTELVSGVAT